MPKKLIKGRPPRSIFDTLNTPCVFGTKVTPLQFETGFEGCHCSKAGKLAFHAKAIVLILFMPPRASHSLNNSVESFKKTCAFNLALFSDRIITSNTIILIGFLLFICKIMNGKKG